MAGRVAGAVPGAGKVPAMTILLASFESGGTEIADSGTFWAPYYIGGGILLVLLLLMAALLAFGKGREHS
jgi:hypothetical protein